MGQVLTHMVGRSASWKNIGQVIKYLFGRGASWEKYR